MDTLLLRADARRIPLADRSVDLVIGSPPYVDARLYLEDGVNLGIARQCREWIDWMLDVTAEALRVSRGLVLWVVAGKTDDWCYQPAPEGLLYRWWEQGGDCHAFRPCYWHRNGIPGSGGEQWYRSDVEYVLAFKRPGRLPFGNPTANGHLPRYAPGGAMSYRLPDGTRYNAGDPWKKQGRGNGMGGRKKGGEKLAGSTADARREMVRIRPEGGEYLAPVLANPGTLLSTGTTGGNQLGSKLAHENEAPYPEDVPAFFINSHCPPSGVVLDPFSGSGTTVAAAISLGRSGIGLDLRQSQCRLGRRRLASVTPGFAFSDAAE